MVVSWYVWHQTKKLSWLGPLSGRVAYYRVVSGRTCVNISLVHTCVTRHDTTSCDKTELKTKAQQFFSLVPHIPRHDHAT